LGFGAIVSGNWKSAYSILPWFLLYVRIASAKFGAWTNLLAMALGVPLVAYLFAGSIIERRKGAVTWKGRIYQSDMSGADCVKIGGGKRNRKRACCTSPAKLNLPRRITTTIRSFLRRRTDACSGNATTPMDMGTITCSRSR